MNHIDDMDQLRQGIGLQAYGQRDPLVEYKMNAYEMFENMTESIKEDTIRVLCHIRIEQKVEREQVAKVTGTNKDESGLQSGKASRFTRTIPVLAAAVRNTKTAAERTGKGGRKLWQW